ncbi:hypothetical protein [Marisediminicola sp. LYQ134]|uniref:hypothetical protein n=1 Tax=unclassified Marisediminicola TaxID=2618316 RepID=UPI0039831334
MTELDLISHWTRARWHIIVSQLGPIVLLTSTIAFLQAGLADTPLVVRLAAAGILLATGVLGAATQIAAATEGRAVVRDLEQLGAGSSVARSIISHGRWVEIVRVVGPIIFVVIFALLLAALFIPGLA